MVDTFGLEQFDEGHKPSDGFSNGLNDLPDNQEYQFLITKTELRRTPKSGKTIFEMALRVEDGEYAGKAGIKTVFLSSQDSVNIFSSELGKLGFDTDKWTPKHGRRFSTEFLKIKDELPGLAFKGFKKMSKGSDGKDFLNIYVSQLLPGKRPIPKDGTIDPKEDPFG